MTLDDLTSEMITTLNQFHELDLDTLARDKWLNYYQKAREHYNTLRVHQIDEQAYEYANKQLKQYYNSIIKKED